MGKTNFEKYLEEQLKNPAVKAEYDSYGAYIRNVEALLKYFDARRGQLGFNKTQIAKRLNLQPSNVRRLFSAPNQNPSFAAVIELANCLDLEIRIVPKEEADQLRSNEDYSKSSHLQVS